jgi:hypothetical protein
LTAATKYLPILIAILLNTLSGPMEAIQKEYERLNKKANLSKTISDVDRCLQLLQNARDAIASGISSFPLPHTGPSLIDGRSVVLEKDACKVTAVYECRPQ